MKLIIYDFEVFKHDVMIGLYVVDNEDRTKKQLFQTWDREEIKKLYYLFQDAVWIGHNNMYYDNHILESIVMDKDPYNTSKTIINGFIRKKFTRIKLFSFDLNEQVQVKLKVTEAFAGKNIHTSDVAWNIDRPLTEEEKQSTMKYNESDLEQTYENFMALQNTFDLKLNLIKEFNLDLSILSESISNISAICLGVNRKENLPEMTPYTFNQLKIKNQELLDFYYNKDYKTKKFKFDLCGVQHTIGIGGIHAARNKYFAKSDENTTIWYFDVAGYYNLLMINYGLFSRSMNDVSKERYKNSYYEQLKLKKTNPTRRETLKTILLAVFGSMQNKMTEYYDEFHFAMVTLNGQLFLVDLLEKLEPYIELIQSNTDGIVVKCDNKHNNKVIEIINEWQDRTKFTLKMEKVNQIIQRDVNCYLIEKEDGEVNVLGEAIKYWRNYDKPFTKGGAFAHKEPLIIAILTTECLLKGEPPENLIEKYKDQLNLFQFICKRQTFDKLVMCTNGIDKTIQEVSRAFPAVDHSKTATIFKVKFKKRMKVANLPAYTFVYNEDIRDSRVIKELQSKIDWQWFIDRVYERLETFI